MRLYEMSANYQQILNLIEEGVEGLEDTLESLTDAIEDKVENIGKLIKTIDAEAAGLKAEETRLADRRKSLEANVERLKKYAYTSMKAVDKQNINTGLFTFRIQKNNKSVDVLDDSLIPKKFFVKQAPTIDKKAILAAFNEGKKVKGVQIKQTESLRIK